MPPGYALVPDLEPPPPTEESGALTTAVPMVFDFAVKDEPEEEDALAKAEPEDGDALVNTEPVYAEALAKAEPRRCYSPSTDPSGSGTAAG